MNRAELLEAIHGVDRLINSIEEYVQYSANGLEGMIATVWGKADPDGMLNCYVGECSNDVLKPLWASQLGQDKLVAGLFNFMKGGYFIEIGCGNGTIISNTYTLEHFFEWRGLLVEPSQVFCQDMKRSRTSRIVECAISAQKDDKTLTLITGNVYGSCLEPSPDSSHADFLAACVQLGLSHDVRSISVDGLCREFDVPAQFEYLSLDIEGGEYDIIKAWPFKLHRPLLLSVEHNYGPTRKDIRELLHDEGYSCFGLEWDDFFVSNQLLEFIYNKIDPKAFIGSAFPIKLPKQMSTFANNDMSPPNQMDQPPNPEADNSTALIRARLMAANWSLNEQCLKEIATLRDQANQSLQQAREEIQCIKDELQRLVEREKANEAQNEARGTEPPSETSKPPLTWKKRLQQRISILLDS
jgi:FkbM family methyltransferase